MELKVWCREREIEREREREREWTYQNDLVCVLQLNPEHNNIFLIVYPLKVLWASVNCKMRLTVVAV